MSDKLHIEELFRNKLGDAEITPSAGAWKGIRRKMRWKQFTRFSPDRLNIWYLGGLLVAGAGIMALIATGPDSGSVQENAAPAGNLSGQSDRTIVREDPDRTEQTTERREAISAAGPEQGVQINAPSKDPESEEKDPEPIAGQQVEEENPRDAVPENMASGSDPAPPAWKTLVTYFTASVESGCAPLAVEFRNQSINAEKFTWSFGDGTGRTGKNAEHTFNEPGQYPVTLTAEAADGRTSVHRTVIEVHARPDAEFTVEEGLEGPDGLEELNLINYSEGGSSYMWKLGKAHETGQQAWTSDDYQPSLPLSDITHETQAIMLVAVNEHGCSDTARKTLPELPGPTSPSLRFPSAFSPNTTGPQGGSYSPNDKRREIFHPVFETVPAEYRLRIYTRRGELVFETDNIYIGWDGYHQQERAAGGVYVWMAEGSWPGGEEFSLKGDVTLIWTDLR